MAYKQDVSNKNEMLKEPVKDAGVQQLLIVFRLLQMPQIGEVHTAQQ